MMACADDHHEVSHSSLTSTNILISPIFTPHYTNLLPPNPNPAGKVRHEERRRILKKQPLMGSSSRWNPTTEQLLALEELYRRGTRTPTAEQIQQIAAYLRRFGRIEEKNVFYWFQNHKARERQKRRRTEMASLHFPDQQQHHSINKSLHKQESVMIRRTGSEVKHMTKKWAPLLDCCILMEESANSMHRAAITERETKSTVGRHHGTWQSIQMPCPRPPPSIQTMTTTLSDAKLSNTCHYGMLFTPTKEDQIRRESITLNLFPAPHGYDSDGNCITGEDTKELPIPITRDQFFEFLPLKN